MPLELCCKGPSPSTELSAISWRHELQGCPSKAIQPLHHSLCMGRTSSDCLLSRPVLSASTTFLQRRLHVHVHRVLAKDVLQTLLEDGQRLVDLLAADVEGRQEAHALIRTCSSVCHSLHLTCKVSK